MATILEKNTRRFRVQFSMSRALYGDYQQCLHLAEELKVTIDFSRDFERWFSVQLEQANRELRRLKGEQEEVKSPGQLATVKPGEEAAHGDDQK